MAKSIFYLLPRMKLQKIVHFSKKMMGLFFLVQLLGKVKKNRQPYDHVKNWTRWYYFEASTSNGTPFDAANTWISSGNGMVYVLLAMTGGKRQNIKTVPKNYSISWWWRFMNLILERNKWISTKPYKAKKLVFWSSLGVFFHFFAFKPTSSAWSWCFWTSRGWLGTGLPKHNGIASRMPHMALSVSDSVYIHTDIFDI